MMLERLQKKYRPQILQPLATGEIGPLDLVDITQPPVESQQPHATLTKPNMTRAQQLLKKSHIVTAQQKVKVCCNTVSIIIFILLYRILFSVMKSGQQQYKNVWIMSVLHILTGATSRGGRASTGYWEESCPGLRTCSQESGSGDTGPEHCLWPSGEL